VTPALHDQINPPLCRWSHSIAVRTGTPWRIADNF